MCILLVSTAPAIVLYVARVEAHSMIFQFARVVIHSFNNCCSQQRRGLWPTVQEFCVSSRVLYRIFATEGDFTCFGTF